MFSNKLDFGDLHRFYSWPMRWIDIKLWGFILLECAVLTSLRSPRYLENSRTYSTLGVSLWGFLFHLGELLERLGTLITPSIFIQFTRFLWGLNRQLYHYSTADRWIATKVQLRDGVRKVQKLRPNLELTTRLPTYLDENFCWSAARLWLQIQLRNFGFNFLPPSTFSVPHALLYYCSFTRNLRLGNRVSNSLIISIICYTFHLHLYSSVTY